MDSLEISISCDDNFFKALSILTFSSIIMIVNSKYDNIILPSTSTPSNIQNRVGAGFPLDWHVKEACNCQSWLDVKLFFDDDEFQFEEPDCPHHRVQLHLQKLLVPHLRGRVVDGLGRLKITLISFRTETIFSM